MAENTHIPSNLTPTGAPAPNSYRSAKSKGSYKPIINAEREALGFYDQTRAISIDRTSGLFIYNFKNPPRVLRPSRPRRGIEPLKALLPLTDLKLKSDSPLFWRPRLLIARMRYLRKTDRYNPYLRCEVRIRSMKEQEAVGRELKAYIRLQEDEETRKNNVVDTRELEDYIKVLKERRRARRAEDKADMIKLKDICEGVGLDMKKLVSEVNAARNVSKGKIVETGGQ